MRPFKSITYAGPRAGTRLIVLGAVHGNETCGTHAIERVARELDSGALRLQAGRLTLVPVTNALAYAGQRRAGDRNLNRKLAPTETPREFEDHVANWLCPLLADTRCCSTCIRSPRLACHSSSSARTTTPARSSRSRTPRASRRWRRGSASAALVDGWLSTYAAGTLRRRELAALHPEATLDLDPRYGIGTTEYMRSVGGWAVTLECGQHADPQAPQVAYRAIVNTLAHLGLSEATTRRRRRTSKRCA